MSASESSASSSPSPPPSPDSTHRSPPNLERLVVHFVGAKTSLASTTHVFRANELVNSSRSLVEEIAVLTAKNAFGRRGLDDQVDTLHAIRDALVDDGDRVADELKVALSSLDKAHHRLEKTLKTLRKTVVEVNLVELDDHRQTESDPDEAGETQNEKRTLIQFIDEDSHESLMKSLRALIDEYQIARGQLDVNFQSLDTFLTTIANKLSDKLDESTSPDKPTIYDEPPPSIDELFHKMEEQATEMASNLSNLVQNYDLCISALKHIEGGGEAAKQAVQTADLAKDTPGAEESLYIETAPEPISDEELYQMLNVIEKDSDQVEDVVTEIVERGSDMESDYQQLSKHAKKARLRNRTLREVLDLMREVRAAIPSHLEAAARFHDRWLDIHASMQAKTQELVDLSAFYEDFVAGYGKLLLEVHRRKASEVQMKRIAERAQREIDKIYDADQMARQDFIEEYGHVVPTDLGALHGLEGRAPRWEIRAVTDDDYGDEVQGRLNDG